MQQKSVNMEGIKPAGLELKDRLVGVQRVTKVTKGGRAFGFSAIVVVGDEHGVVGHGLGKSNEVASAIAKAIEDAKKSSPELAEGYRTAWIVEGLAKSLGISLPIFSTIYKVLYNGYEIEAALKFLMKFPNYTDVDFI